MTFSERVRQELMSAPLVPNCCARAEIGGMIAASQPQFSVMKLHSADIAERCVKLMRVVAPNLECAAITAVNAHRANLHMSGEMVCALSALGVSQIGEVKPIRRECCKRAYMRGVFLGAGLITDPNKAYHIEFPLKDAAVANAFARLLEEHDLPIRLVFRVRSHVVYLKDGGSVATMLVLMGANDACLAVESIRVDKGMRGEITRQVNCDTFNLTKTIEASARSIDSLNLIRRTRMFDSLPADVLYVALMRESHPEASIRELGEMCSPPLNASSISRRLKKLDDIAATIEQK